jgi:hypothetical protein
VGLVFIVILLFIVVLLHGSMMSLWRPATCRQF